MHISTWGRPNLLAFLVLLALVGCAPAGPSLVDDDDSAPDDDDDSGADDDDSAVAPGQIEVVGPDASDPLTVDFGQVPAGTTATASIQVGNVGLGLLEVSQATWNNSPSVTVTDSLPVTLVPSDATFLTVEFSPGSNSAMTNTLTVHSSDPASPEVAMSLLGQGVAPQIELDPGSYDFGNPVVGSTTSMTISIRNLGLAPLDITSISLDDLSGNGELSLTSAPSAPLTVAPGGLEEATITYQPTDVSPDTGVFEVISNDPTRPVMTVTVFGIAYVP